MSHNKQIFHNLTLQFRTSGLRPLLLWPVFRKNTFVWKLQQIGWSKQKLTTLPLGSALVRLWLC